MSQDFHSKRERDQGDSPRGPNENAEASSVEAQFDATISNEHNWPAKEEPLPAAIGKYKIKELLGRGGQASVFLAHDPDLDRQIVIKLYHHLASKVERDRILSEGRLLARIDSPYVAKCFGAEWENEAPYLILEYIRGETLDQRFRNVRPDTEPLCVLLMQLLEGLSAVHACGLIHRDIKPSNLILGEDHKLRIADFGLAATLASSALADTSGTVCYMSPEQARGDSNRVDQRTDIFAVGAVLFFLLTGRAPYESRRFADLFDMAKRGKVQDVRELNPSAPDPLAEFCKKCLEAAPDLRFADAGSARLAVENFMRVRAKRKQSGRVAVLLGGTCVLAVALGGVVGWQNGWLGGKQETNRGVTDSHSQTDAQLAAEANRPLVQNPPATSEFSFDQYHPDGRVLRKDFALTATLPNQQRDAEGWVHLSVGDEIAVQVSSAEPAFLYVWVIQQDGALQVFPNEAEQDERLLPQQPRTVPGKPDVPQQEGKVLVASSPSQGLEYLHIVATNQPIEGLEGEQFGPYLVLNSSETVQQLAGKLRDFSLKDRTSPLGEGPLQFSEVIIPLQVSE